MSFKIKTVLLFLGISLIPYALTMILLGSSFRQEQYKSVTQDMQTQLHLTVEKINQNLKNLQSDMIFITKSDIMNDIYTHDLDSRISNTLLAKKNDLKLKGDFYLLNQKNIIIASSNFSSIGKMKTFVPFFVIPVLSNFTHQQIGKLIVTYPNENFKSYFSNLPERHYYLSHHDGRIELRPSVFKESLKVSLPLAIKPNLTIILEEEKLYAYRLVNKYEQWFIMLLIFGALFISLAAYYIASKLIHPIIALSNTVKEITLTQDYTQKILLHSDDEIGHLSDAFNTMMAGMDSALSEITALSQEIEETQREVVFTMGAIGESRSKETGNHVKRVAEYSKLLALHYGLSKNEAEMLKQASPMHDIGKVGIPDAVLNKPGRFNEEERLIMDTHAGLGYEMLKYSNRPLLKMAAIVAHEHHEKWDGSGYPKGLIADKIHIYGRITALADVFDALGSDRVYKKAWDDEKIFKLFEEEKGKHFDPHLINIFFNHLDEFLAIREHLKDSLCE